MSLLVGKALKVLVPEAHSFTSVKVLDFRLPYWYENLEFRFQDRHGKLNKIFNEVHTQAICLLEEEILP